MTAMLLALALQTGISVPGFTAYLAPNPEAFEVDEQRGVIGWNRTDTNVVWYGKLAAGSLEAKVQISGGTDGRAFKLKVDGQTHQAVQTAGNLDFGSFQIGKAGYKSFALEALGKSGETLGSPSALLLNGSATNGAHFNLKSRRNSASVHLGYPFSDDLKATKFYDEVTPREDPLHTYYCAAGFKRGYFGIQVNGPKERRIIFSVWDAGGEANDRDKVSSENRVKLLAKGDGVVAGDFGNEGTGGHSHMVYSWKKNQTYRFLVTAKVEGTATIYSGYFWFPEKNDWGLIASFRAPKDGGYLRGFYSFDENFWGTNGNLKRKSEFGNQWIQTEDGKWIELTKARFTHDGTGKEDRKDYSAGPIGTRFFLQNGGFEANGVKLGDTFDRKPTGKPPVIGNLP